MYAKFPYCPLRIKKALGIFQKGNNNLRNNNLRSNLGPFPGPKMSELCSCLCHVNLFVVVWHRTVQKTKILFGFQKMETKLSIILKTTWLVSAAVGGQVAVFKAMLNTFNFGP